LTTRQPVRRVPALPPGSREGFTDVRQRCANRRIRLILGDQVRADLFADETVRDAGQVNPRDNFAYVFDPKFEELVMNRMDRNNDQVGKFLEDPQLKSFITSLFRNQVYDRIQAEMKTRILQT
jgi:hypothetical protein